MHGRPYTAFAQGLPLLATSRNLMLRRLSVSDQHALEPHASHTVVGRGDVLFRAGGALDSVYFPETAVLSIEEDDGPRIEVALIGREGLVGWPLLLGSRRTCHSAVAHTHDGLLIRVAIEPLVALLAHSKTIRAALLPFVEVLTVQMARAIVSHACDHMNQRLARFILMRHDRVGGDEIMICHDEIAGSLGTRRASVTDTLHVLEADQLVRARRGRLLVRNRAGLEAVAGAGYGVAEHHYRQVIGPFGKSAASRADQG